jgi:hypothetical protein
MKGISYCQYFHARDRFGKIVQRLDDVHVQEHMKKRNKHRIVKEWDRNRKHETKKTRRYHTSIMFVFLTIGTTIILFTFA